VLELMRQAREQLRAGAFAAWSAAWLARYRAGSRDDATDADPGE
jgi:hypothetical protein